MRQRGGRARCLLHGLALVCACALAGAACEPAPAPAERARQDVEVLAGIDVLLRDGAGVLAGKRIGLITNHTGLTRDGRTTIDALASMPDLELVALFAPEHGIRGEAQAGVRIEDARDAATGLPIHSLYSGTRQPTPDMLAGLDALMFDVQDIGARYYTYIWTMALALEAAAAHGTMFVVLDRPNPVGGRVDGNVLDPAFASFVGLHAVPMRHGLTVGEMAQWINGTRNLGAQLIVVRMEGWRRDLPFEDTGLPWRPPSPNMPTVESALHYPGTCLFEGTNLSVGRGTSEPFRQIGAPWLDGAALAQRLSALDLPGVRFEAITFTPRSPGDGKHDGVESSGIRLTVTDRAVYDPTATAVHALIEARALHPDRFAFLERAFDRLAGTDALRLAILAGKPAATIVAGWTAARAAFERESARFRLYP